MRILSLSPVLVMHGVACRRWLRSRTVALARCSIRLQDGTPGGDSPLAEPGAAPQMECAWNLACRGRGVMTNNMI